MFRRVLIPLVGVVCLSGCFDILDESDPSATAPPAPLAKRTRGLDGRAAQPPRTPGEAPSSGEAPDEIAPDDNDEADAPSAGLPKKSARRRRRRPRKRYASSKPKLAQANTEDAAAQTKGPTSNGADDGAADAKGDAVGEISVNRLVISSGVSGREPVGAATSFAADGQRRIYAFVEVNNGSGEDSAVTVTFYRDGARQRGGIKMKVGASRRWRTWATTRHAKKPGTWHAVVRGPEGKVLARTSFTITAPKAAEAAKVSAKSNSATTK